MEPHTVSDDIPLSIRSRFDTVIREHRVGTHLFRILTVRDPVTLLDAVTPATFAVDERLPYWAELWTSALVLAEQCLVSPVIGGKRVLDLGCGLGLTGIAAAAAGAEVLFTDYEEDALAFAEWNARTNLTAEAFARSSFRTADWRTPGQFGTLRRRARVPTSCMNVATSNHSLHVSMPRSATPVKHGSRNPTGRWDTTSSRSHGERGWVATSTDAYERAARQDDPPCVSRACAGSVHA